VYIHVSSDKPRHESSGQESATPFAPTPELRDFGLGFRCPHRAEAAEKREGGGNESREKKGDVQRKVAGTSAALRGLISTAAYVCVRENESEISGLEVRTMKICAWLLSCVALIVVYSAELQKYLETLRTLKCGRFPIPSLWKSPLLLGICAAFTCF